jgi:uncharacterized membrane protein YtjA (UPF0391 family)
MLGWALSFLLLALVAGLLGFFALAGLAAAIAKVLLLVFLVLLLVSAFSGAFPRRPEIKFFGPPATFFDSVATARRRTGATFVNVIRYLAGCKAPAIFLKKIWNRNGGESFSTPSGCPIRYAPAPSTPRIGCPLPSLPLRKKFRPRGRVCRWRQEPLCVRSVARAPPRVGSGTTTLLLPVIHDHRASVGQSLARST